LFALFDIHVCHGWTVDPQDEETFKAVTRFASFNAIMEKIVLLNEQKIDDEEETRQCTNTEISF
jgi:hypothetical protein